MDLIVDAHKEWAEARIESGRIAATSWPFNIYSLCMQNRFQSLSTASKKKLINLLSLICDLVASYSYTHRPYWQVGAIIGVSTISWAEWAVVVRIEFCSPFILRIISRWDFDLLCWKKLGTFIGSFCRWSRCEFIDSRKCCIDLPQSNILWLEGGATLLQTFCKIAYHVCTFKFAHPGVAKEARRGLDIFLKVMEEVKFWAEEKREERMWRVMVARLKQGYAICRLKQTPQYSVRPSKRSFLLSYT